MPEDQSCRLMALNPESYANRGMYPGSDPIAYTQAREDEQPQFKLLIVLDRGVCSTKGDVYLSGCKLGVGIFE